MENNFVDDDDTGEIIEDDGEFDAEEFVFGDPFIPISSDESNTPNESISLQSNDSRNAPESTLISLSPEESRLLNEFSLEQYSKELLSKAGTGDFIACLNNHWKNFVPICFNALDVPTKNLIETDSTKILLKPLEIYICNNIDSDKVLSKLNELDDPPVLCGKVFKAGEPSYFCRDCGSDPTCVLCSNCFRKSKHRHHRYKMMTSSGGGYCDCGDPEAWKKHPNCELHMPKSALSPNESDLVSASSNYNNTIEEISKQFVNKLPKDIIQRATELFSYLLEYIFEVLSIENSEELPNLLRPDIEIDDYVTILYNDEVHSYEQVVTTLRKVLLIDDKKAFEYAAIVDKEGRSTLKRSKKQECLQIKTKVETTMGAGSSNNSLETKVMHHSLVAHQYFAEKLVVWLQKICDSSKSLKHILCQIGLFTKPDSHCIIEKLMLADSVFWKSARSIMHQFFISIYFMDPLWKREFAILYTKNYKLIWKNHVKNPDDTVSLTDLAVQMFTVLSLSKFLLTKYNLLQIIMETLIEHCKTNKGKLSFPRSRLRNNPEFKRAQYMLFDLKYCLTATPDEWNDELRKNFINGFKSFVEFIKFMHGMDCLKRLTQSHVEFEPEWETSFNLLIKLQKSITSLIDWCSSDQVVFLECYKYLLNAIHQVEETESLFMYNYEKRLFKDQNYEIIDYAVIRQEVSIHAPLTRLFGAIYAQMEKFSLNFHQITNKLQANNLNPMSSLKYDLPRQKIISLIEPSIRALVLVSQTNIGLWKRNGFSLLSQVFFYSNIKCRQEMFDRDILCLQIGASIQDPNEFLINLLCHYGLFNYLTDENFEILTESTDELNKIEYLIPLSEDFLELLIYVFSERYESNLSNIEPIKKLEREVIHQLCIAPMAHSDLVKNIYPDNEKYTNDLEAVLNRIAVFKSSAPTSNTKGVYELKTEYQSYFSPYFYHYAKSERTKSEEYQLSLRKDDKDKFFKPPRLPSLTNLFANITHLLDSDVFIQIATCILKRSIKRSQFCTDGQLIRLMHLIGLALHEEQDDVDKNFENDGLVYNFKFLDKFYKSEENITKYLTEITEQMNTSSYKLLTSWVLDYSQKLLKLKHKIDQQKQVINEPKLLANDSQCNQKMEEQAQKEKRKSQIAEKRRAKIMAQINTQQKNFIKNYQELYDETKALNKPLSTPTSSDSNFEMEYANISQNKNSVVCLGQRKAISNTKESAKKRYHCILCQEDDELSMNKPPMVLCCYITNSRVLSQNRSESMPDFETFDPLFMKNEITWGINTTSCGHVMHANCWQKYVDTVRITENRRHARYHGFNIKRNEYLCPLCETIGNSVLPIFPDLNEFSQIVQPVLTNSTSEIQFNENSMDFSPSEKEQNSNKLIPEGQVRKAINLTYDDWLDGLEKTIENSIKKELQDDKDVFIINPCPLSTITKLMADAVATNFRSLFEFDSFISVGNLSNALSSSSQSKISTDNNITLHSETVNIMENFTRGSYTFGFSTLPNDDDSRMPISVWTNCSYTIQVIDQLLNVENKLLFGQFSLKQIDLLHNIVKQAALYGIIKNTDSVRKNCVKLLASILPYKIALFDSKNIMELDMFYLLVSLCLSLPNLYDQPKLTSVANGGINDSNIFKLILQAHCVQIILTKIKLNTFYISTENSQFNVDTESDLKIYEFYKYIIKITGEKSIFDSSYFKILESITPRIFTETLKLALLPFLRCSALFFSNLTNLTPTANVSCDIADLDTNFETLISFLGINSLVDVLDIESNALKILCESWLSIISTSDFKSKLKILDLPLKINKFIELPQDFVDLISMSMSSHVCSLKSSSLVDTSPESATIICLICGEMLCSQAYCCQQEIFKKRVGCCTAHAYKCSGTVGMFLRVSECQVLMLHLNMNSQDDSQVRGCFLAAPYLDDYGETDQGLRRGNPLHLCKVRYEKLYKDWLSHAIPEEVSRSFQNQTNMLNINWMEL